MWGVCYEGKAEMKVLAFLYQNNSYSLESNR